MILIIIINIIINKMWYIWYIAGMSSPFIVKEISKMIHPIVNKYNIRYNYYHKRLEKIENDDIFE